MTYRREIDGLRGIAVLGVLLFHAGWKALSGGFLGVDVFFVISGYLITQILVSEIQNQKFSFSQFYFRRARRILPALFVVIVTSTFFSLWWMTPQLLKEFFQSLLALLAFGSNIFFWLKSGYFDSASEEKPLLHTWSLSIEEQVYFIFPFVLVFTFRYFRKQVSIFLFSAALISLLAAHWAAFKSPSANFYLLPTRAWELLMGSLCAFIPQVKSFRFNNFMSFLGIALILSSFFLFNSLTPNPSLYTLIPVIGSALIILCGNEASLIKRLLSHPSIVGVGLISYSLYLWHQPVFAFLRIRSTFSPSAEWFTLASLFTFLLSFLTWKYIEQPFRRIQSVDMIRIPLRIAAVGTGGLVLISLWVIKTDGLPQRMPNSVRVLLSPPQGRGVKCGKTDDVHYVAEKMVICKIGAQEKKPELLFLGDSHTGSLNEALSELLEDLDLSAIMVNSAVCAPLIDFGSDEPKSNPHCRAIMNSVYNEILTLPEITTVVLFARWALYTEGGAPENRNPISYSFESIENDDPKNNPKVFSEAFQSTIKKLRKNKKKVILIKSVPEHKVFVTRYLIKAQLAGSNWKLPSDRKITRKEYEFRNLNVEHSFSQNEINKFAKVIETKELFCPVNECNLVSPNGTSLYGDDNHLTYIGTKLIVEQLKALISPQG